MAQFPILVILAGGSSSRMWPLREKLLMRFGTETLILSQLQRYSSLGFQEAIIIASPSNHAAIREQAANVRTMTVRTVIQQEPKGMGDAILQIAPLLEGRFDQPIYVMQVHDVVDDALHSSMLAAYQRNPEANYIAGYEMDSYFPGGYLIVSDDGRITGIVEKPGAENRPSNLVNIVAHIFGHSGQFIDAIRHEYTRNIASDDHYERAMDALMKAQIFRVVPYSGAWKALKYPWHVLDVMEYFLSKIDRPMIAENAFIAQGASIVGNVFIGAGAKIFPGAAVVGPAFIGANTIIGNNALVRSSMVLSGCEVGFTTEVARSYVAEGCALHACRVLDSVFAPGVNFSAGCTTANLRIDRGMVSSMVKEQKLNTGRTKLGAIVGQEAFISVDAMTMPGVKIGERANIGPGTHVHRDVRDGTRVYVKQEVVVVDPTTAG